MRLPRNARHNRAQGGFTLVQVMLGLAVISAASIMAQPALERGRMAILRSATIGQIFEISQAAKTHYIDEVEAGIALLSATPSPTTPPDCPATLLDQCWPDDLAELIADNYLGDDADLNGYGLDIEITPNGRTIIVDAQAPDVAQANLVAVAFGGLASVDSTTPGNIRVQVEFAAPGIDAEHQALLDRFGERQMEGPIVFDMTTILARTLATGNVALDLNDDGDIIDVRRLDTSVLGVGVDAPTAGGIVASIGGTGGTVDINTLGNINAPSGLITTFTSDNLTVNQDAIVQGDTDLQGDTDIGGDLRVN